MYRDGLLFIECSIYNLSCHLYCIYDIHVVLTFLKNIISMIKYMVIFRIISIFEDSETGVTFRLNLREYRVTSLACAFYDLIAKWCMIIQRFLPIFHLRQTVNILIIYRIVPKTGGWE